MISKDGYTAIEMLIALALISILATLGLANYFSQLPHYELRDASQAVISDLRKIRQMAVKKGMPISIDFYPDDGENCDESYAGQGAYCDSDNPEELRYRLPRHVRFGSLEEIEVRPNCGSDCSPPPENGITFQGDPPTTTFRPNGMVSSAGAVYLTNHPTRNEAIAITVNFTGRVKLWHWVNDAWK